MADEFIDRMQLDDLAVELPEPADAGFEVLDAVASESVDVVGRLGTEVN